MGPGADPVGVSGDHCVASGPQKGQSGDRNSKGLEEHLFPSNAEIVPEISDVISRSKR